MFVQQKKFLCTGHKLGVFVVAHEADWLAVQQKRARALQHGDKTGAQVLVFFVEKETNCCCANLGINKWREAARWMVGVIWQRALSSAPHVHSCWHLLLHMAIDQCRLRSKLTWRGELGCPQQLQKRACIQFHPCQWGVLVVLVCWCP